MPLQGEGSCDSMTSLLHSAMKQSQPSGLPLRLLEIYQEYNTLEGLTVNAQAYIIHNTDRHKGCCERIAAAIAGQSKREFATGCLNLLLLPTTS